MNLLHWFIVRTSLKCVADLCKFVLDSLHEGVRTKHLSQSLDYFGCASHSSAKYTRVFPSLSLSSWSEWHALPRLNQKNAVANYLRLSRLCVRWLLK